MIEVDPVTELVEIKNLLHLVLREMKELKRQQLPADPEDIQTLLHGIHKLFACAEWTAAWVFEQVEDDDPASRCLRETLLRCLDRLTIRKLSFFLTRIIGLHGHYNLVSMGRSRCGQVFKIVML